MNKLLQIPALILFTLFAGQSAYAQHSLPTERPMKGNIRSIQKITYNGQFKDGVFHKTTKQHSSYDARPYTLTRFDSSGRITEELDYTINDKLYRKVTFQYNPQGLLLLRMRYATNTYSSTYHYAYDKDGRLTEQREYQGIGTSPTTGLPFNAGSYYSSVIYQYNANGQVEEKTNTGGGQRATKTTYLYDNKGRLTEEQVKDHKLLSRTIYTYSGDSPIPAKKEIHNRDINARDSVKLQFVSEYDSQGRLIKHNTYPFYNYHSHEAFTYKYNQHGDIISVYKAIPAGSSEESLTEYRYEYDPQGNWMARYEYSDFGHKELKPVFRTCEERIIEYW